MENFLEFLDKLTPVLYIAVPAIAGVYFKLKEKIKIEKERIKIADKEKSKEIFKTWAYDESRNTIKRLKDLCNLYKDKGNIDLVNYLQLENGTVTTAKLHNMYVSCLAEDNRYGNLPKLINQIQRLPYNSFVEFVGELDKEVNKSETVIFSDVIAPVLGDHSIKSYMYSPVCDMYGNLVGAGVFYFSVKDFNHQDVEECKTNISHFKAAIEMIFFEYAVMRNNKIKELDLEDRDVQ